MIPSHADSITPAPRKSVTVKEGGISFTRLFIAMLTLGISIPFIGIRRRRKTTTINSD